MMPDSITGLAEVNLYYPIAAYALSNTLSREWDPHKGIRRYPDFSDKEIRWPEAHHCVPKIVGDGPTPDAQSHKTCSTDAI